MNKNNIIASFGEPYEHRSVIKDSILFGYADNLSDSAIADRNVAFACAVNAFTGEATEAFSVSAFGAANASGAAKKYELTRHRILKLLLYIGYDPDNPAFGLIAGLVEMRVRRPDAAFSEMLTELSQNTGVPYKVLDRELERSFSYYDGSALERMTYVTGTVPMSARDAVCDLAVYVRISAFDDVYDIYE